MVAHHMCLRRIREKSIIHISGDGDRIVLLSTRDPLIGRYPNLDQEVVHAPLVGLNLIEHMIKSEVDPE